MNIIKLQGVGKPYYINIDNVKVIELAKHNTVLIDSIAYSATAEEYNDLQNLLNLEISTRKKLQLMAKLQEEYLK